MRGLLFFFAGVATGLLLAPESGDRTLQKVRDKISDLGEDLEDKVKEKLEDED